MGKILTNSQGKVITAGGNAFEVTAAIDPNIQQGNIKKGVTILGVTGTYEANLQTLNVTPSTSAQQITPTSPVDGYNEVNVSAVTSAIDQNIVAGNIKKDVDILGVTGTYDGGSLPEAEENDVIFIDYDGTIRYSYTAAEFAQLSAMPANPSHEGLTAQGWNWSLADAKAYVAECKELVIGQMYITDDGKTRLYISLDLPIEVSVRVIPANMVIDWGDGTSQSVTYSGGVPKSYTHQYSSAGDYVISFAVSSEILGLRPSIFNGGPCTSSLTKVELGAGVKFDISSNESACFRYAGRLTSITIPKTVNVFGALSFGDTAIEALVIPPSSTFYTSSYFSVFYQMHSLKYISLPKMSPFKTSVYFCGSLRRISIPNGTVDASLSSQYYFGSCFALKKLIVPSSVTAFGSSYFFNSSYIAVFIFHGTTPPNLNASTFGSLPSEVIAKIKIYVPYSSDHSVLAAYKAASNWSAYADRIYELDENGNIPTE